MYGVPGSHKNKTTYFNYISKNEHGDIISTYNTELPKYDISGAIPLEVKKGSVVLLHGDFVHFSNNNSSSKRRHAYTMHCVESKNHKWLEDNWIQRVDIPFRFVNKVNPEILL